jgi:biotin carboxyl carrier protein
VQYEVEINGRIRQVAVSRSEGRITVTIDGRAFAVDPVRVDSQSWSLIVEGARGLREERGSQGQARVFDVTVTPDAVTGQLTVCVGATPVMVGVNGRRRRGASDDGAHAGGGPQKIVAPMPGKIVRVLARAGDAVAVRQPLVVVEAMKMENELRATRAGTVGEIHVREGQSVDAGTLLVVIQ